MSENAKNDIHELLDEQLGEVAGGKSLRLNFTCSACGHKYSQNESEISSDFPSNFGICPNCGTQNTIIDRIDTLD